MEDRFVANKFGLFNFWYYYDVEEFELSDGKIIFRGSNGSGKSVTTQSFIPLLLDGDKRPHRIDPFGTKARKIDNYLLMDDDDEDRIAYLYIEFKKPSSDTYITIGMGLRAKKGKNTESWYFILKDGRRINKDVMLYKMQGEKLPLTSKEFYNALGNSNVFTTSQSEYMKKVNEHLYGYSNIDDYKDLLNLLIELRSPKLSKDFKPTVIYSILKKSLSTLNDDDLRPMAEAMDNMDILNNKLDELDRSFIACESLKKGLDKYNLDNLYKKSKNFKTKSEDVENESKSIKLLEANLEDKKQKFEEENEKLVNLQRELDKAKVKEESLKENEGFKIRDNIAKKEEIIKVIKENLVKEEEKYNKKNNNKISYEKRIEALKEEVYKKEKNLKDLMEDEVYYKEESYYSIGENISKELSKKVDYDFNRIFNDIDSYETLVSNIYSKIVQYESILTELNKTEEMKDSKLRDLKLQKEKLKRAHEYFTNIKTEATEKINKYAKSTKELKLEESIIKDIFKKIYNISNEYEYLEIDNIVKQQSEEIRKDIFNKKLILENSKDIKLSQIEDLEEAIAKLKSENEIFKEHKEYFKCSQILKENNIDYEVFYKTINFKDNIDEDKRKIVENGLLTMGILDSFLVSLKDKAKVKELLGENTYKILFSNRKEEKNNLLDYFNLEKSEFNKLYYNEIKSILASISAEKNNEDTTYLDLNNEFKIGILSGGTNLDYSLKYIGSKSRENYRKEKIESVNSQISIINEELEDIKFSIKNLLERETILNSETKNFPDGEDIKSSIAIIKEEENNLSSIEAILNSLEEAYFRLNKEFNIIKVQVYEETNGINISKNKKAYEETKNNIIKYRKTIIQISHVYKFILNKNQETKNIENIIEDLIYDLDNIYADIISIKDDLKSKSEEIQSLKEVLSSMNLGEIEKELDTVTYIINTYPSKINTIDRENIRLGENIKTIKENIIDKNRILDNKTKVLKAHKIVLDNELSLKYIDEINDLSQGQSVKWILDNYNKYNISQKTNPLDKVYELININSANLLDYNLKKIDLFNDYEESENEEINTILKSGSRIDVRFRINKKEISIYRLSEHLRSMIDTQRLLIGEKEREVFEDTLINTLSTKINARINRAKAWVNQINSLMESMDTSNGLKLSLRWSSKKADNDMELDIKHLTYILSTPHFMTDNQRKEVSEHFKTQLKKQKRILSEENLSTSYQSIIKEVLDYRQWFEFKLLYSNPLSKKSELTDNEFFRLSGGEKAMSMYIPLFAAVNARYNAADKKDCPRIIALDEAFAGVDEQNISHMFNLIESLDLDYVLNSQVLWGTYDSVKSLAIYELIRQGDDVVVPIKYKWNGKVKTMEMSV